MRLLQRSFRDWNSLWLPAGRDTAESFNLGDLWDRYAEWSAYGAGAEVLLHDGDRVDQYYVPYLSAIQIYTNKSRASLRSLIESLQLNSDIFEVNKPTTDLDLMPLSKQEWCEQLLE